MWFSQGGIKFWLFPEVLIVALFHWKTVNCGLVGGTTEVKRDGVVVRQEEPLGLGPCVSFLKSWIGWFNGCGLP